MKLRGRLSHNRPLADLTWLRVGGAADIFFQPADTDDLADFMRMLPPDTPVFPMGVGSNLIVRDGGLRAAVVRLGRPFRTLSHQQGQIQAGAACLDAQVAKFAAQHGIDLTFLRTIPGSIGGALRMNAGCYGSYMKDVFVSASGIDRQGNTVRLSKGDIGFSYRQTDLPPDLVITDLVLEGPSAPPQTLDEKMTAQLAQRDKTQPTKLRSAGSTFRNPKGSSAAGKMNESQTLAAWYVIDQAGCRGLSMGDAQMSPLHPNFMVNNGTASAKDLENLGEEVRKRVYQHSGITLEWEIVCIGEANDINNL